MWHSAQLHLGQAVIRPLCVHFGILLTWAVLMAAAFPPLGWVLLAHVALVPAVFLALNAVGIWRLAWTSFLISLIWWLYMLRWLIPVTGVGYVLLAAYMAVYLVVALLATRWLWRRCSVPMVLLLPMVWVCLELIRGFVLAGGFGWYALSHSQAPWRQDQSPSWFVQVADLFGEHGVSFLVAMTNGMVVDLLWAAWARRSDACAGTSVHVRAAVVAFVVWLGAYGSAMAYGRIRLLSAPPSSAVSIHIAVVQTNISQGHKEHLTEQTEHEMWNQLERLTTVAAEGQHSVDLVIWPESAMPTPINAHAVQQFEQVATYWQQKTADELAASKEVHQYRHLADQLGIEFGQLPTFLAERFFRWAGYGQKVGRLARQVQMPLVVGSLTQCGGEQARGYNSVYLYGADGTPASIRYDKFHRVPFGEYIPWVDDWPWLKAMFIQYLTPYEHDYTLSKGRELTVFRIMRCRGVAGVSGQTDDLSPAVRFATPICFEDTVPRVIRHMVYAGGCKRADLLVNVSNDGWFQLPIQGYHHMQIASLRCIENRVPMARSVNTGPSGFIDSCGRIGPLLNVGGQSRLVEGVVVHEVRLDGRCTAFGRWGHLPMELLLCAIAAFTLGGWLIRPKI